MNYCNLRTAPDYEVCGRVPIIKFGPGVEDKGAHMHFRCSDHQEDRGCCMAHPTFAFEEPKIVPTRPSLDRYFMDIAHVVASRGSCSRAQVGCVIVDPQHRIISSGYNGARSGAPHCDHSKSVTYYKPLPPTNDDRMKKLSFLDHKDQSDLRYDEHSERFTCAIAQHAERNALDYLVSHPAGGIRLSGLTLYTTHSPCIECAQYIHGLNDQWGLPVINRVVYAANYHLTDRVKDMLKEVNLEAL